MREKRIWGDSPFSSVGPDTPLYETIFEDLIVFSSLERTVGLLTMLRGHVRLGERVVEMNDGIWENRTITVDEKDEIQMRSSLVN